jgi:hypothetical protein
LASTNWPFFGGKNVRDYAPDYDVVGLTGPLQHPSPEIIPIINIYEYIDIMTFLS